MKAELAVSAGYEQRESVGRTQMKLISDSDGFL